MAWIGLVSPQGHTEYNAKFLIGESAEKLENGKWYTNQELADLHGSALFLGDSSGDKFTKEGWMNVARPSELQQFIVKSDGFTC